MSLGSIQYIKLCNNICFIKVKDDSNNRTPLHYIWLIFNIFIFHAIPPSIKRLDFILTCYLSFLYFLHVHLFHWLHNQIRVIDQFLLTRHNISKEQLVNKSIYKLQFYTNIILLNNIKMLQVIFCIITISKLIHLLQQFESNMFLKGHQDCLFQKIQYLVQNCVLIIIWLQHPPSWIFHLLFPNNFNYSNKVNSSVFITKILNHWMNLHHNKHVFQEMFHLVFALIQYRL